MRRVLMVALAGLVTALLLGIAVPAGAMPAGARAGSDAGPFRVLVYSRTTGFRHYSIEAGKLMIEQLGRDNGFAVETTEDPKAFTPDNLARFAAVVFLSTTGDVLDASQQDAFERYVRRGGGWVGIHSAADTEYDWPFYGELLAGAWFKNHPLEQSGTIVNEAPDEPSAAHLPERWDLPLEEFYAFRANPRGRARVLLSIDESTYEQDPNTSNLPDSPTFPGGETGTMGDHPMSWCHDVGHGRAWYTALGHEAYLYELDDFRRHVLGGILTAARRVEADCRPAASDVAGGQAGSDDEPGAAPSEGSAAPSGPSTTGPSSDEASAATLPATGSGGGVARAALLSLAAGAALRRRRRGGRRRPDAH